MIVLMENDRKKKSTDKYKMKYRDKIIVKYYKDKENEEQIRKKINYKHNKMRKQKIIFDNHKKKHESKIIIEDYRLKRNVDVINKIIDNLSTRACGYFKKYDITREMTHMQLLGCNKKELKEHIQSKFINKMSYNNYGKWEVDHINPISRCDNSNIDEIIKFSPACLDLALHLDPIGKDNNLGTVAANVPKEYGKVHYPSSLGYQNFEKAFETFQRRIDSRVRSF